LRARSRIRPQVKVRHNGPFVSCTRRIRFCFDANDRRIMNIILTEQDFRFQNRDATIFVRIMPVGSVFLAAAPKRMVFSITETPPSDSVVSLLQEARAAGFFHNDEYSALVDLSHFTGIVDWNEIKKIGDVLPKGDTRTNKNAFVVRNEFLGLIAKIAGAVFPNTQCAAFKCESEARAWLGWT